MKVGDKVTVKWGDGSKSDEACLLTMNVTIRTERGGVMNGMVQSIVGSIEELQGIMKGQHNGQI